MTPEITMSSLSSGKESREDILTTAEGFNGQNVPRGGGASSNQLLTTKKARGALIGLRAGETITNLWVQVDVKGETLTNVQLALYDKAGTLLAKTADLHAAFEATGIKGGALEAPFVVPSTGGYYIGILAVGTTPPSILVTTSGVAGNVGATRVESTVVSWSDTTERVAPETFVAKNFGSSVCPWVAFN